MKKHKGINDPPVTVETDWAEPTAEPTPGQACTKPGRHHLADYVAEKKVENEDRRQKTLRDLGGRERDPRRIPTPEHQESGRTWKSSSKIRFPSREFRANYELINWKG